VKRFHIAAEHIRPGVAKLRLASRMQRIQELHAALWTFWEIIYLFFILYFYCKV